MNSLNLQDPREYALKSYTLILSTAREIREENKPYVIKALNTIKAFAYNPSIVKSAVTNVLLRLERQRASQFLNNNVFNPPRNTQNSGIIHIGQIVGNNSPASLTLRHINENIGIWGRAGVGKTNLTYLLCIALVKNSISVRAYDYKNEYRDLIPHIQNAIVLNPKFDKFNPLEPIGNPNDWLQFLGDTLQQDFNLRPETKFMWLNYAQKLYEKFGVYKNSGTYPSLKDMHHFLISEADAESTPVSNRRKIYTCLEVLNSLFTSLGNMLDCSSGYTEKVFNKFSFVSYEMSNLSSNIQSWLSKIRLKHLYDKCLSDSVRHQLKTVGVFDEAKMLFGKNLHAGGTSVDYLKQLITQARASGFGAIISDQNRAELADFVVNNISCQICFNLASPKEIRSTGYSLGCNEDQIKQIRYLKIPHAIMSFAGMSPFMITIPKSPVREHISDTGLEQIMRSRLADLPMHNSKQNLSEIVITNFETPQNIQGNVASYLRVLSDFLTQIKDSPDLNISQLYAELSLSGRMGNKIKSQLFENKLITEEIIRTGARKRPAKRLLLTYKGEKVLTWLSKKVKAA